MDPVSSRPPTAVAPAERGAGGRRSAATILAVLAAAGLSTATLAGAAPAAKPAGPPAAELAAEAVAQSGPESQRIFARPAPALDGLPQVWRASGLDAFLRAFPELLDAPAAGALGGPRADLSPGEWLAFYEGRVAFRRVYGFADGLGPFYNDVACGSCHSHPVIGGGGPDMTKGVTGHGPAWTGGDAVGVRKFAAPGFAAEVATGPISRMHTPPLFGLGLLDAVPESARIELEDPDDRDGDGIRGRRGERGGEAGMAPARFGHKANEWDLQRFCAGALNDEMGVTNTVRRMPRADRDVVADPEADPAEVLRIVAFVRDLAPPPRLPVNAEAARGEKLVADFGCTRCHVPTLGPATGAYTDLLLHDLGDELAGLKDGAAGPRDWRTAPLWGLRLRAAYLHDDRAPSVEAAIVAHGGEARRARDAFVAAPVRDRAAVLAFLATL